MKKIEKLTKKQEQELKETLAYWLNIGRGTERLNRSKVKSLMAEFYRRIDQPAPKVFFFDSPMTCMLAAGILRNPESQKDLRANLRANLGANLRDNLRANLWANLTDNLSANLWANLGANLRDNLRDNLGANLGDNLRANLGANLRANLGDNLGDNLKLDNYFAGGHWCYWEVWADFGNKIGVPFSKEDRELLDLWLDQSKEMHWWFPYKGIVLVSDRPIICKVNARGRLHNESDMAIKYADGWGIYSLNGVTMKEEHVMTPANKIDSALILKETNVEVRRELLKKVGVERMLEKLPHKILDKDGNYSLLSVDLADEIRDCKYLKMLNPSIGVWHLEGVARECKTVQQAINWRAGDINKEWKPLQLT